jgi:hypothetical protein
MSPSDADDAAATLGDDERLLVSQEQPLGASAWGV